MNHLWLWLAFGVVVLGMLAADLGLVDRHPRRPSLRAAAMWTTAWVGAAAAFCGGIWATLGRRSAVEFATGYVVEEALSVDNLFVFLLIFSYFRVPADVQHRVLFWGVVGALALRAVFISAGALLITHFEWVTLVFGAFLVIAGARLGLRGEEAAFDPKSNPALKLVRRVLPVSHNYDGPHFFVRPQPQDGTPGRLTATPLFVVLVLLETTDLLFAVDSIPAVFGVTRDAFLVYTSNVFAVLGLRSMFFLLAGVMDRFYYLRYALALVLAFVGAKMLLARVWAPSAGASLAVIVGLLAAGVVVSLLLPKRSVVPATK